MPPTASWGSSGRRFKSCQPDKENPLRPASEGISCFRLRVIVDRQCAQSVPTRRMLRANFARAAPSHGWWARPRFLRYIEPLSRGPLGVATGVVDRRADHSAERCGFTETEFRLAACRTERWRRSTPRCWFGFRIVLRHREVELQDKLPQVAVSAAGDRSLSFRVSAPIRLGHGGIWCSGSEQTPCCTTGGTTATYTCRYGPRSGPGRRRRLW